jgi:hypothetical protein
MPSYGQLAIRYASGSRDGHLAVLGEGAPIQQHQRLTSVLPALQFLCGQMWCAIGTLDQLAKGLGGQIHPFEEHVSSGCPSWRSALQYMYMGVPQVG